MWRTDVLLRRLVGYEDVAEQLESEISALRDALIKIDGIAVAHKRGAAGKMQKVARSTLSRQRKADGFSALKCLNNEEWI